MYFYRASAVGLGGTITTPSEQVVEPQATSSLPMTGGYVSQRAENFNVTGIASFRLAYTELGGSFDATNNAHTTYARSVIEGLNIADIVTVDRVVSHVVAVSPQQDARGEHSFDITGSHFENMRITGQPIDIKLATQKLHQYDTFSKFERAYTTNEAMDLLPWGNQTDSRLHRLEELEKQYCKSQDIARSVRWWKSQEGHRKGNTYWCSAAGHLSLEKQIGNTELQGFGGIIAIPRLGLIYLAELLIEKSTRQLNMLRVELDSPRRGTVVAGTTEANGTSDPVPTSAPALLPSVRSMPTDDSEERARELTRELLRTVRRETGAYASRKRDIYVADVEVAVERFEFFLRIAERVNAPLFCLRRGNDVPIPIAVLPQERGLSPSAEPWHNLGNFEDIYLDREARGRIESYPARETLAFFEQRLEGFLTDRFRARRSDISELPGLPVRVTTRSDGLRAYYSPAYFFDGTQVLNGPTTPTVGWIQPGRYIFGAGSPGKTPRFDFAAEYHVPRGSSNSPVGEYMVSDPTDVFLNL